MSLYLSAKKEEIFSGVSFLPYFLYNFINYFYYLMDLGEPVKFNILPPFIEVNRPEGFSYSPGKIFWNWRDFIV